MSNRLRALHIIEAELNLIRRELIARVLIQNTEAYNMIPMNNCGGRSGKTALDVVILKYSKGLFLLWDHNIVFTKRMNFLKPPT